jgi:ATP-dependent RNA helicase RhlE
VRAQRYTEPTPIQSQAIPHLLAGRDLLGCAQTGTGKTAAFALPILQRLAGDRPITGPRIRVLVIAPTRELASQICDSFRVYGRYLPFIATTVFGGVGQDKQVRELRRGVDILVATPGRLLDLMGQGHVRLDKVEAFVLDEADRMLDMGFIPDIRRIIAALPQKRQTLLFSATIPTAISALAQKMLVNPVSIAATHSAPTPAKVEETVLFVERAEKLGLLRDLLRGSGTERALVFTRTKHGANKLVRQLGISNIVADAIHGNKSQSARERALKNFRTGNARVLVATDIAARGIDVQAISHVFNYDLPIEPELYVHRIGRTARAGADGKAISLCSLDERGHLRAIEKLLGRRLPAGKMPSKDAILSR